MIKRTVYFGNPAYLSLRDGQLVVNLPSAQGLDDASGKNTVPIEDIGVVVLDNRQITITQGLISALLDNNAAIITCDERRMPVGLLLPLSGNTIQNERFRAQLDASLPLQKQLWQQTIQAKITNQAIALRHCRTGVETGNMEAWAKEVRSGDTENMEARAAAYYWSEMYGYIDGFKRDRDACPPNNLLNYGYAILRAVIARSLVGSGLLPTFGIHHHNRYNAYCLADDIMEPYRPFVDCIVDEIVNTCNYDELTTEIKRKLLSIPVLDVMIDDERSPLMIAAGRTTASLARCFIGENRSILYPKFCK